MMYLRIGTDSFMANSRWHSWLILPGARHSYGSKHCDCWVIASVGSWTNCWILADISGG